MRRNGGAVEGVAQVDDENDQQDHQAGSPAPIIWAAMIWEAPAKIMDDMAWASRDSDMGIDGQRTEDQAERGHAEQDGCFFTDATPEFVPGRGG